MKDLRNVSKSIVPRIASLFDQDTKPLSTQAASATKAKTNYPNIFQQAVPVYHVAIAPLVPQIPNGHIQV